MSDKKALLAAIVANPDEDTPRLAFADWLDENAQDDIDHARAEFIRLQIAENREPGSDAGRARRIAALSQAYKERWWEEDTGITADSRRKDPEHGIHWESGMYMGGFLSHITCTPTAFHHHGEALLANNPIHSLKFTEHPGAEDLGWKPVSVAEALDTPRIAALQRLIVEGCNLDSATLSAFSELPLHDLRTLDIRDNPMSGEPLRVLADLPLPKLSMLGLVRADLHGDDMAVLARRQLFHKLTWLNLENNRINEAGICTLATAPCMQTLRALHMGKGTIDSVPKLRALLEAPLHNLTHLTLRHNNLDENVLPLLAQCTTLPNLNTLDLSHNHLLPHPPGDTPLLSGFAATPLLPRLEHIHLGSRAQVEHFIRALAVAWTTPQGPQRTSFFALKTCNGMPLNTLARTYNIAFDFDSCPAPGEKAQVELQKRYCANNNIPNGPDGVGGTHVR